MSLSCVLVSNSLASCRSRNWLEGAPDVRFTFRPRATAGRARSEEHTSELQSLMRISYAVFCLKKQTCRNKITYTTRSDNWQGDQPTNTRAARTVNQPDSQQNRKTHKNT